MVAAIDIFAFFSLSSQGRWKKKEEKAGEVSRFRRNRKGLGGRGRPQPLQKEFRATDSDEACLNMGGRGHPQPLQKALAIGPA
jgi:hypothetical protein